MIDRDNLATTLLFAAVLSIVLSIATFRVVDRILEYKELELYYQSIEEKREGVRRRIPFCNKELWLRITEGCNVSDT